MKQQARTMMCLCSLQCLLLKTWLLMVLNAECNCFSLTGIDRKLPIKVNGTRFYIGSERFFLSGANTAWVNYGADFGNGQYENSRERYLQILSNVSQAGANSMRTWVHVDGHTTPLFNSSGFVVSLDANGTFLSDFRRYLDDARAHNILVFATLWTGASVSAQYKSRLEGLIKDTNKLQSYLDNALIPWVKAVKDHPALGGWDIMNEMEGVIKTGAKNREPCFDTRFLVLSTAGFAEELYSAKELLRFINWQADAIRKVDPQALVTAGSWRQRSQSDRLEGRNLYKDACLLRAGGRKQGTLTFYSTHVYTLLGPLFWPDAAFFHNMSDYGLDKPLVLGEFSQVKGGRLDITEQFTWAYTRGYSGAWSWQAVATGPGSDPLDVQVKGISVLKGKDDQTAGGRVPIDIREKTFISLVTSFADYVTRWFWSLLPVS